ncbi:MAG: Tyrosine-tRNA ligase [Candidatus Gottesmanbacteria bacterium GW2011_GWC2_39_8]|uniref:Tyrosine--tRNA ligase n=1 Tax=Candidatus Gottesmanbacteria bacterium GW2011_GWC2_39_8 TaxID=1618450 RepID=A0A0G0SA84_9BACT|nr:MAG: Tyrosine-tRNA ligase [Candidatus Gottesmanbacteria bacterium GW2011_GWC2_39_8]
MDKIDELLARRVDTVYPTKEALEKVLRSGKKLRMYQGFDPSGIQLHIGHLTGLLKLKQFQDLGHHVIFLVGDGTGQAGDPSGKTRTRDKYLSRDELRQNAKDYLMQASKIVSFDGDNPAEILYNSDWLNELKLVDILNIADHFTLQQLEERDMFIERKKLGEEINFREFMYPLLQGYDSAAMKVDLELGGSDQMFNMLAGRKLVKEIQTDASGKKIGKTEGNVIALTAPPPQFYGMILSLSDDVIGKAFEYITEIPMEEVMEISQKLAQGENPMTLKKKLAWTLTAMLNSYEEADEAQMQFENIVQKGSLPEDIPVFEISSGSILLTDLLVNSKLTNSKSEAKRLIEQGGVEVNEKKITDTQSIIKPVRNMIVKAGKRKFIKLGTK